MTEKIILCSFITYAIWYSLQPAEIFGKLGTWFSDHLPGKLHNPVFDCPVCMGFWYGSLVYWLTWHNSIKEGILIAIATVGLNAIISGMTPDKKSDDDDDWINDMCCGPSPMTGEQQQILDDSIEETRKKYSTSFDNKPVLTAELFNLQNKN